MATYLGLAYILPTHQHRMDGWGGLGGLCGWDGNIKSENVKNTMK